MIHEAGHDDIIVRLFFQFAIFVAEESAGLFAGVMGYLIGREDLVARDFKSIHIKHPGRKQGEPSSEALPVEAGASDAVNM